MFRLYDTYGFPLDLTSDIARERGFAIDEPGFEAAMEAQRARARAASKFGVDLRGDMSVDSQTAFAGYDGETGEGTRRRAVPRQGSRVTRAAAQATTGQVVLDVTPFYAESGGQVGDAGELTDGRRALRRERHAEARRGAPARRQARRRHAQGGRHA